MIRFSAVLIGAAIAALIAGVVASSLQVVYLSIGVSAVAAVLLVAGVVWRREEIFGSPRAPVASGLPSHPERGGGATAGLLPGGLRMAVRGERAGDDSSPAQAAGPGTGQPVPRPGRAAPSASAHPDQGRVTGGRPARGTHSGGRGRAGTAPPGRPARAGLPAGFQGSLPRERPQQGPRPPAGPARTSPPSAGSLPPWPSAPPGAAAEPPRTGRTADSAPARPVTARPAVTGPVVTGPAVAGPAVTGPVVTGPVAEPGVTAGTGRPAGSDGPAEPRDTAGRGPADVRDGDGAVGGTDTREAVPARKVNGEPGGDGAAGSTDARVAVPTRKVAAGPGREEPSRGEPAAGEPDAGEPPAGEPDAGEPAAGDGTEVTIVPGITRYHRRGCTLIRFLSAGDLDTLSRAEAEAIGCVPCRACQPDKPAADG